MSQASLILSSLTKRYEQRSYQEHKILINALALFFPTLTPKKIKLLTFFLEARQGNEIQPDEYSTNSFIITFSGSNPQLAHQMRILGKKAVAIREGDFAAVLDYEKYLNAELLGDTTVEKELGFWETSEYFCSMPKKKFIELIRRAKVLAFSEGQCVYNQGQMVTQKESGSGVFVVRSGEFGCYHNAGKDIQTSHFSSGHIFGALELMSHAQLRATTIRCKTSSAVVYNFCEKTFNQLIRHYCQSVISQRQGKLMKFVALGQMEKSKSVSFSHNLRDSKILRSQETTSSLSFKNSAQKDKHLEENQFRAFPSIRLEQIRQTATTSFYKSTLRESQRLESQALKRTNYLSLKKDGPLKNYPLPAQRSNFLTSEFRDLDKIFQKRPLLLLNTENPSDKPTHGVWRRDMMSSFYRQTMINSLKRTTPQQ